MNLAGGHRRWGVVVAPAGLVGGLAMYLAPDTEQTDRASSGPSIENHAGGPSIVEAPKVGDRCPGAKSKATLTELRDDSRTPVYLPDDVRPTDMWMCGHVPMVMVGQIQVMYERGWDKIDPAEKWPALLKDNPGRALIETIAGRPAYINPGLTGTSGKPGTPPTPRTRSGLQFVVNGTKVVILAEPETPVEKLIDLAKSMKLPAEGPHYYVPFDPKTDPDINPDLRDPNACDIEALENCHS